MKINPSSIYNVYKNQAKGLDGTRKSAKNNFSINQKTDTLTISSGGAKQFELNKVVQDIAAEVNENADPKRLADLKAAIDANQYSIPTSTLADAILGKLDRKA